jgi:hypothetical protein
MPARLPRRPVETGLKALSLVLPTAGQGQATADQSRLSIGILVGASSGASAWNISGQPLVHNGVTDTITLGRRLNGSITGALGVAFFPHAHWGFTGEIALIGGRYDASCAMTSQGGSVPNAEVCASINQSVTQSRSVSIDGGVLYRPWSRKRFRGHRY